MPGACWGKAHLDQLRAATLGHARRLATSRAATRPTSSWASASHGLLQLTTTMHGWVALLAAPLHACPLLPVPLLWDPVIHRTACCNLPLQACKLGACKPPKASRSHLMLRSATCTHTYTHVHAYTHKDTHTQTHIFRARSMWYPVETLASRWSFGVLALQHRWAWVGLVASGRARVQSSR